MKLFWQLEVWHKLAGNVIKKDMQDELLGKFFYFPVACATSTMCIQYKKTKNQKKKKGSKKGLTASKLYTTIFTK
jgi:acetoacetate decarboxylase